MDVRDIKRCTAFEGYQCIASGSLADVAGKVKEIIDRGVQAPILIFDDFTSEVVEVDFRGTAQDVLKRVEISTESGDSAAGLFDEGRVAPRGPGRPKLGVVSREVTLLPKHWDWLNTQPGGASVALRKLVEEAKRVNSDRDKVRQAQEAAYRFMSAMAGNLPGFEEATRALFAGDPDRFNDSVISWPADIKEHARNLSDSAFHNREQESA